MALRDASFADFDAASKHSSWIRGSASAHRRPTGARKKMVIARTSSGVRCRAYAGTQDSDNASSLERRCRARWIKASSKSLARKREIISPEIDCARARAPDIRTNSRTARVSSVSGYCGTAFDGAPSVAFGALFSRSKSFATDTAQVCAATSMSLFICANAAIYREPSGDR